KEAAPLLTAIGRPALLIAVSRARPPRAGTGLADRLAARWADHTREEAGDEVPIRAPEPGGRRRLADEWARQPQPAVVCPGRRSGDRDGDRRRGGERARARHARRCWRAR